MSVLGKDTRPPQPSLETDRLVLRRWYASDRETFAAINADAEVMAHFPARLSRGESDQLIEKIEAGFEANGFGLWALELRDGGEMIGFAGLSVPEFEAPFTPTVEVGWRLARSAWGRGYATEAGRAALEFGFGRVGLTEVVSFTSVGNARSRAVMERFGMSHDPAEDFDHPRLPEGHRLRRHVLYRLARDRFPAPRIEDRSDERAAALQAPTGPA